MTHRARELDHLWLWFAFWSVVCLAVLAISPFKDYFREYRGYQEDYRERLLEAAGSASELRAARAERVGIRQIWLPELDGRVDRCVSCHLGVESPGMAGAPRPFGLHPPTPHTPHQVQELGCVACHRGQGRATTVAAAHGEVEDWDTPLLPLGFTEASCGTCHREETVPEAALLSEGRRLMDRAGCLGCHRLSGHEDWESTAPDLDALADKTHVEWLRAWLADPESLQPGTWMPDFELPPTEVEALTAYLWAQPAKVPLPPDAAEPPPGDFDRGRKLFRESRCISCHTVGGRGNGSAPELGGVGSKVHRSWLIAYLGDPHAFQPRTEMPRFEFTAQDLIDLSQYMIDDLVDPAAPAPEEAYRPAQSRIERGGELYRRYGCGGCHRLGGELAPRIGPELDGIGDKAVELLDFGVREDLPRSLPAWLAAKVTEPRSFREDLKMPVLGLEPGEIQALLTALLSETGESLPTAYRTVAEEPRYDPAGRFGTLFDRYRCLACHRVGGVGGDISTAPLTAEGSKVQRRWLEDYLLLPTTIRPILTDRMIHLRMPEEEAAFLADYMENVYLDDDIPGEIFPEGPPADRSARGRRLFFERYGCQACHQAEGTGGYYGPPLDDSADKLESGWIAWWLQGPQRWRADVRCPDYGLEATDAGDLAAYLMTLGAAAVTETSAEAPHGGAPDGRGS